MPAANHFVGVIFTHLFKLYDAWIEDDSFRKISLQHFETQFFNKIIVLEANRLATRSELTYVDPDIGSSRQFYKHIANSGFRIIYVKILAAVYFFLIRCKFKLECNPNQCLDGKCTAKVIKLTLPIVIFLLENNVSVL